MSTRSWTPRHATFAGTLPIILPAWRENTRIVPPLLDSHHHPTPRHQHASYSTYGTRQNFHCCNYNVELVSTRDAHIFFVAPTKPLVSQQAKTYFEVTGILKSATMMLTDGISPGLRAEEWQSKRVFFIAPQTIVNDLKTGIYDLKGVVRVIHFGQMRGHVDFLGLFHLWWMRHIMLLATMHLRGSQEDEDVSKST